MPYHIYYIYDVLYIYCILITLIMFPSPHKKPSKEAEKPEDFKLGSQSSQLRRRQAAMAAKTKANKDAV